MPTAELVNPFAFDLFRPRGEEVVGFTTSIGAVAGQAGSVWVVPGGGKFLIPIWFQATFTGANLFVGFASKSSSQFAIGNNVLALDNRALAQNADQTVNLIAAFGAAQFGVGTLAPLGTTQNFMRLPAGLSQLLNIGLVLNRPGTALVFSLDTGNVALTSFTLVAYERSFETQENV